MVDYRCVDHIRHDLADFADRSLASVTLEGNAAAEYA